MSDHTGDLIHDRYQPLRTLGEGTFAHVTLCEDRRSGRQVAVKELRPEHLQDWKHFELFEREARVLASLRHHGVPEVIESFESQGADGRPRLYLIEEYVEGTSLLARIDAGPRLGRSEVWQLTLDLLDILEYLHTRSPPIFHRDIKPSNIILRPTGAPVLLDFGGVRDGWRTGGAAGSTVLGTHGYAPPEQYLGQAGPGSDLYALGATLLHTIGGRPPGEYAFDTGRFELPDELPADPALRVLLRALLEPAPRNRPASAGVARTLLLEGPAQPVAGEMVGTPGAGALVAGRPQGAQAVARRQPPAVLRRGRNVAMAHSKAPRFVDLGPAPRDRRGVFADVYQNAIAPRDTGPVAFWFFMILLTLISAGLVPLIAFTNIFARKRRFDPLFERGRFVEGHLVSITQQGGRYTFMYEFEVAGQLYRGAMTNVGTSCGFFAIGDRVGVLYDPQDIGHNCFVYRTQGQALAARTGRGRQ